MAASISLSSPPNSLPLPFPFLFYCQGETFHILAKNGGWWLGIRTTDPAAKGWLPCNYLSISDPNTGKFEKVEVTPRTQAGQVRPETISGAVSAAAGGSGSTVSTSFPSTKGKPLLFAIKALHKFDATQADGLSFAAGEVLSVIDKKDGWYRSINAGGKEGWVPSNYVVIIEGSEGGNKENESGESVAPTKSIAKSISNDAGSGGQSAIPSSSSSSSSSSSTNGTTQLSLSSPLVSISTVVAPSPRPDLPPLDQGMTPRADQPTPRAPDLPSTDGYTPTPRSVSGSSSGSGSGSETPEEEYMDKVGDLLITPRMAASIGQTTQEKVRALFNFDAKKSDHLSFKKGDIMIVLKKKQGWWKCQMEGISSKVGYVPNNYVKLIVEVEAGKNETISVLNSAGGTTTVQPTNAADVEPSKEKPLVVKALHNYKALANNQLSFNKHDILHVIYKNKGWWKAYRTNDAEKVGYIPSNYVKIYNGEEAAAPSSASSAAASSSSSSQSSSSAAAASASVEMEEIAVALHDLEKKDPKCLPLKRDERFFILDKNVGGGWWRCTSQVSGETGLTPSNFLKTEMVPKRQPPALPAARGTVPNQQTYFVECLYEFNAKKPSQLSFKKYEVLILLKKEGSWWKAKNKLGKEGVIPYNYCKEIYPMGFTALFDYNGRPALSEISIVKDEVVTVSDMDQPGWWHCNKINTNVQGWLPSAYLFPNSNRVPGQPVTPRPAQGPEIPSTPRSGQEGATNTGSPAVTAISANSLAEGGIKVESGSVDHGRKYSGSVSSSLMAQTNKEKGQLVVENNSHKVVASVVVPPPPQVQQTPRPEFITEPKPSATAFFDKVIPNHGQIEGQPNNYPEGEAGESARPEGSTKKKAPKDDKAHATSSKPIDPHQGDNASERGACSSGFSSFLGLFSCTGGDRNGAPRPEQEKEGETELHETGGETNGTTSGSKKKQMNGKYEEEKQQYH